MIIYANNMIKSNEIKIKHLTELPQVNYSKLPKSIEEATIQKPLIIEEKAKLTWDGRQYITRIPSEIAQEMKITIENRLQFRLIMPIPSSGEKPKLEIELV